MERCRWRKFRPVFVKINSGDYEVTLLRVRGFVEDEDAFVGIGLFKTEDGE
jgi:hypothetical protein